jgi:pyruvate dehydrogenase E1 component
MNEVINSSAIIPEPPDDDRDETYDWVTSLAEVIQRDGLPRAEFLVDRLIESGRRAGGRFQSGGQ